MSSRRGHEEAACQLEYSKTRIVLVVARLTTIRNFTLFACIPSFPLILPVLLYGAEAWTLLRTDAAALRVFERKVLRKIFGSVRVGDDFRIRFNSELYELLNDVDVVLRWLGHAVRMEQDVPARRVFDAGICGSRRRERPCIRWKDQIEESLSSSGVTNWRRGERSRDAWKNVLRNVLSLLSHCKQHK